ncbi:2-phospho-L-lactate transferase CofD family protein, partial [Staphylococcus saprophyticus]|uniref:2-phospho-L-lactate transferase CofD family protein n=1 Tax=Staphylococcus saprophyticus TaxID=29385 RepID=UPI00386C547F
MKNNVNHNSLSQSLVLLLNTVHSHYPNVSHQNLTKVFITISISITPIHISKLPSNINITTIKLLLIPPPTPLSLLPPPLKHYPIHITTILTLPHDRRNTPKITNQIHIPPPPHIRNLISPLTQTHSTLQQLFQYPFKQNQLQPHSLPNLLIPALT